MTKPLRETFETQGYVVFEGLFARTRADRWLEGLRARAPFAPVPEPDRIESDLRIDVIPAGALDGWLGELHHDPALAAATRAVIGEFSDLMVMLLDFEPGGRGGAWHQDCSHATGAAMCLNRLVYPRAIGGEHGGELVVVPGSHRRLLPVGGARDALEDQRSLSFPAGSLVLMHGALFHRVEPPRDASHRYSMNLRVMPRGTDPSRLDTVLYRSVVHRSASGEFVRRHAEPMT